MPCPSNLKRWRISDVDSCSLCNHSPCYTPHILSGCKIALTQGRYTYRHDTILNIIHSAIKHFLDNMEPNYSPTVQPMHRPLSFNFVKKGTHVNKRKPKPEAGILLLANDWTLLIDIGNSLVFPVFIAITTSRPDVVIFSKSLKTVILIELTSPCEENFQDRHSDKVIKYSSLCNKIRSNGWNVHFFAIEIGARGYCAQNVFSCFRRLGFKKKATREILKDLSFASLTASFVIWLSRDGNSWDSRQPSEVMKRPYLYKAAHKNISTSKPCNKNISHSPINREKQYCSCRHFQRANLLCQCPPASY